ncbi:MAG: MBL fold metallo-hydrolase, partial [Prolixibacteraceae bacterium]|nr:MBL fold metallo-hydrolase [Prolixibacteraceae bacterium]MBN2775094.1 MBL fold metallo-hydrolase [Prolixibacteraceae bacterium]
MKITILNDNCPGSGFAAEHGLSYLIESEITYLFDTGPSDIIVENAQKANIDLGSVNTIVLSHRHYDHSNGLQYLNGQKLICHPAVFKKNFRKKENSYIGMPFTKEVVKERFELVESTEPVQLSENVYFLGEIPRLNDFEAKTTSFINERGNDDFMLDDSGVAIKSDKGLIIVSGCAHS